MSQPHTHACPSCGAPLVEGDPVRCSYCGSYVTMHDKPRVPRVSPPPVIHDPRSAAARTTTPPASLPTFESTLGTLGRYAFFIVFVPTAICLVLCTCLSVFEPLTKVGDRAAAQPTATQIRAEVQPSPTVVQPTPIAVFGGDGSGPGQFTNAHYIAIDGNDNVYVSDYGSMRLQRFDENGKYLSEWSIDVKGKFTTRVGAEALAADRAGNVYVVWTGLILKYEGATGKLLDTFAGDKIDDTTILTEDYKSIAIAQDGGLWAIADMNSRDDLVHLDARGKAINRIKNVRSNIRGDISAAAKSGSTPTPVSPGNLRIVTDKSGNLYMVNRDGHDPAIYKFTPEGKFFARVGYPGFLPGYFSSNIFYPDLALDSRGRLYVDDDKGIQIFNEDGRYLDVIITKDYFGSWGVAVNSKNEIYMVNGDNMVFKFPPFPD